MGHVRWAGVAALIFGTGFSVGAFVAPQDMSHVGHLYESPTSGTRIRMLLDEAFAEMEKGALPRESRAFDEETKRALEAIGYGGK